MHAALLERCDANDRQGAQRCLLDYPDLAAKDNDGRTLLMAVCERKDTHMVRNVLRVMQEQKCDANLRDKCGVCALALGVESRSVVAMLLLLPWNVAPDA